MPAPLASRAGCVWNRNIPGGFARWEAFLNPLSASDVFLTVRDHERHFPDRGRAFHFDWYALKGARDLGNPQPMRGLGLLKLDR
jgi:hypothetical protein